ncbi:MAG: hypothetical protein ACT6QU_11680 [Aliihoeflea sp.]|uniref:hypothetical protein n=1 Tax=Aliihoeflea sp. TaxID=2608088 RepID=UPI004034C697
MIRFRAERSARAQPTHRFSVGQIVHLKTWFAMPLQTDESFSVTGCMPLRNNEFQYRIRAESERYDRVAGEEALELVEAADVKGKN